MVRSKEDVFVKIIVERLTLIDNRFMQQNNSLRQFGIGRADEGEIARFSEGKGVNVSSWNDIGALLSRFHNQGIDLLQDPTFASNQLVRDFRDRYQFVASQMQATSTRVTDPAPRRLQHAINRGHGRTGKHNVVS